jgi:hypothetical protein
VPHLFDLLTVVLLEYHLSQLSRAQILVGRRLFPVLLRRRVLVDQGGHSFGVLASCVTLLRLSLNCYLYLSLKLHVSLHLSVDRQISQTKNFLLVS